MILYILDMECFEKSEYCTETLKSKKHHQAGQFLLWYALGEECYEKAVFEKNEHGKPYIKGQSVHYNISHSGQYVVLIISDGEVGVDVQECKSARIEALAKRFFTKEEQERVVKINDDNPGKLEPADEERQKEFYTIWCRKEAYGKYLGVGINEQVLHTNVLDEPENCRFYEYDGIEGYQISICCREEEEVEKVISVFEGL